MKLAIVTGANGFIGGHFVRNLVHKGYQVLAVLKSIDHISPMLVDLYDKITIIECDLNKLTTLKTIIREKGVLIDHPDSFLFYHLAWAGVTGEGRYNCFLQLENAKCNCDAVKVAWEIGCTKFVGTGSIMEDDCDISLDPIDASINPGYLQYCAAKYTAHIMGKALAAQLGIDFCWAKISNAYGQWDSSKRFICSMLTKMLLNQQCDLSESNYYYDFIYIDDLVNAICDIGERGYDGHSYYIGSGRPRILKEYIYSMHDITNSYSELRFGIIDAQNKPMDSSFFDIEKLQKHTGFKCKISFEEGIMRTSDWLKERLMNKFKLPY